MTDEARLFLGGGLWSDGDRASRPRCSHSLIVAGAKRIVRERITAGYPPKMCKVPRGTHVYCTVCHRIEETGKD